MLSVFLACYANSHTELVDVLLTNFITFCICLLNLVFLLCLTQSDQNKLGSCEEADFSGLKINYCLDIDKYIFIYFICQINSWN